MSNKSQVIKGGLVVEGNLVVTGQIQGSMPQQASQGQALQVIQGVVNPIGTQPNYNPQPLDVRLYGQNYAINPTNVIPGGTDGYLQIDEYINGSWQHLFEIQPSTTGNVNVLDMFISGRMFARDSLLSAPGRFFFRPASTPFGANVVTGIASNGSTSLYACGQNKTLSLSSDNGKTWGSLVANGFSATDTFYGIAYGNGVFVAVGSDAGLTAHKIITSANWNTLITNSFSGAISGVWYLNGKFFATDVNSNIRISSDNGQTWVNPSTPLTITRNIAYGNGVYVAVGDDGTSTTGYIKTSTDGINWSALKTHPFPAGIWGVAYGQGIFVAVGSGGKIARSLDNGNTWGSLITNPWGVDDIYSVAYIPGLFVAASGTGKVARSLDMGLTWGVKYGDSSTTTVLSTQIRQVNIGANNRVFVSGSDSTYPPIAWTDYVEAGAGIVASGSNANGSYIQFDDGTMICWFSSSTLLTTNTGQGAWFVSPTTALTFPVAFIATPIINASTLGANATPAVSINAESNTTATLRLIGSANNYTGYVRYSAIGRWK
jgi:hypothetical protein